jgi:dihydroorotate dehydrogenase electron transfer subunit
MTVIVSGSNHSESGSRKLEVRAVKILGNEAVSKGIFRMTLRYDTENMVIRPGQFVNLYLNDKSMLLPRPISISEVIDNQISLVYRIVGAGTDILSAYHEGQEIKVSTPLGNGYDLDRAVRVLQEVDQDKCNVVLVAGGLGVPPMVELAKAVRNQAETKIGFDRINLIAVAGFQEQPFLIKELEQFCDSVFIATENGSLGYRGNVLELMEHYGINADYYFSCGPKPMLKALAEDCAKKEKPLQVSLEERMGCGYGACVGCTCKIREVNEDGFLIKQKKVCKDGPVFMGNEVVWDE